VGELSTGGFVGAQTAQRLMCSGRVQQVIVDDNGKIIATTPNTHAVSMSIERAVRARDHNRCTFPACEAQRDLEVHHLLWRINGGPNDLSNLQLICLKHHKYVHEGGWSLGTKVGHGNTWYRPDGTLYGPFDTS
jgi:hypothetical protein